MVWLDVGTVERGMGESELQKRSYARPWGQVTRGLLGRALARRRSLTLSERVAYGSTFVYAAAFTFFAVTRHLAFQSQQLDLGDMTQAIWNTLHGHVLETT